MFKLPQKIKEDLASYNKAINDYLEGKSSWQRFSGIRVPWGNYSHRGGKVFMARIRMPAGVLLPYQLKALAECSQIYGDGILHITTRQDIQIHNIKLEDIIKVHNFLKDYELSSRGGGGNTVRNITACPLAGVCKEEVFDVREDAIALSEYLISDEISYNLPRKFKIAFSGCSLDCAGCLVNDVGLLAVRRDSQEGYQVFVGGGMGAHSLLGRVLEDFILRKDLGYVISAIRNTFYKYGDRKNKHHNRLRFLIQDIGFDKFKEYYLKELKEL
ncbi:MAG: nitrite/sulfite reductase, partial [Candidatus Omnitrophica bacterium]|nr:nitrite/sulfite reductase [Candidatus Omnitrophota bacterium]